MTLRRVKFHGVVVPGKTEPSVDDDWEDSNGESGEIEDVTEEGFIIEVDDYPTPDYWLVAEWNWTDDDDHTEGGYWYVHGPDE